MIKGRRPPVSSTPVQLIIDTDAGVDSALAIIWLFNQRAYAVELLGITTVAGNTSVAHATHNVLMVLDSVRQPHIPVIMGAAAPLSQPKSTMPVLAQGPEGMEFAGGQPSYDLSTLSNDVGEFYYRMAHAHPGATVVSLGPLTNLAQVVARYPAEMRRFGQIVVLGGARYGGDQTPVAEYNFWQDPEAAEQVLAADLPVTIVPLDAYSNFTITEKDQEQLLQKGPPSIRRIGAALQNYWNAQAGLNGDTTVALPDVAAMMYAVDPQFARSVEPALVKIVTGQGMARGQSVMGFSHDERVPMIADEAEIKELVAKAFSGTDFDMTSALGAILAREPQNAQVVLDFQPGSMHTSFMEGLTAEQAV